MIRKLAQHNVDYIKGNRSGCDSITTNCNAFEIEKTGFNNLKSVRGSKKICFNNLNPEKTFETSQKSPSSQTSSIKRPPKIIYNQPEIIKHESKTDSEHEKSEPEDFKEFEIKLEENKGNMQNNQQEKKVDACFNPESSETEISKIPKTCSKKTLLRLKSDSPNQKKFCFKAFENPECNESYESTESIPISEIIDLKEITA